MSRPIKFRFWDAEHQFMWYSGMEGESIALQDGKYNLYNRHVYKDLLSKGQEKIKDFHFQTHFDEKIGCLKGYVYGPAFEVTDDPFPMYDNETWVLKPSEFTGLKDKNGVEIYEGDIVKDFYGKTYQVIYDGFMFNLKDYYDQSSDYPTIAFSEGVFEVIGNIHQNPELLESEENAETGQ